MTISWNDSGFKKKCVSAAMDGLEEWGQTAWLSQARQDCPVKDGTMRNSLGVERSDSEKCVYVGGGGAASDYILKQELDRSLHHEVGKSGFIKDSCEMHAGKLTAYVKKHVG